MQPEAECFRNNLRNVMHWSILERSRHPSYQKQAEVERSVSRWWSRHHCHKIHKVQFATLNSFEATLEHCKFQVSIGNWFLHQTTSSSAGNKSNRLTSKGIHTRNIHEIRHILNGISLTATNSFGNSTAGTRSDPPAGKEVVPTLFCRISLSEQGVLKPVLDEPLRTDRA